MKILLTYAQKKNRIKNLLIWDFVFSITLLMIGNFIINNPDSIAIKGFIFVGVFLILGCLIFTFDLIRVANLLD